jgi:hypothetical protein
MNIGFLRSSSRPEGYCLGELLRQLQLELETQTMALADSHPKARATNLQIIGHLMVAQGLDRGLGAVLELAPRALPSDRPARAQR